MRSICSFRSIVLPLGLALATAGCPVGPDDDDDAGLPILGGGLHTIDSVSMDVIADDGDGLNEPRDLEFHPDRREELWVVNRADNSSTILIDAGTEDQESIFRGDTGGSDHFFAQPSALAFSDNGNFASAQETDELTQGPGGTPEDFMGPTLWTSDLDIYDGGHNGHIDMLHNSPNGMGIAWEQDNVFWVFDGYHDAVTRYDFNDPHQPGGTDHADAEIARHVEGQVRWREDIPSHMVYSQEDDLLYVADTGNNRVAVHDATSGVRGANLSPNYDVSNDMQYEMTDGDCSTLVDGESVEGMGRPSGLAIHDGTIYVTDNRTARIFAFDMEGGLIDWLDTGLDDGSLMGIEFDDDGNLYLVDAVNDQILRIRPQ